MIAHHPTTGQPIGILRTETNICTDSKTLVWIRPEFQTSHRWTRWFTVMTEPDAHTKCNSFNAVILSPDADLALWMAVLPAVFTSSVECILLAPTKIVERLETEYQFITPHTFLWEELFDSYPYLGEPILSTDPMQKLILSLAHILRMNRIVWSEGVDRETMTFSCQMQFDSWQKTCNGTLKNIPKDSDDSCIPQTWLIQQFFRHPSNRRNREIVACLDKNLETPWIDTILLLNEEEYSGLPTSPKLRVVLIHHRITYYDVFCKAKEYVPKGSFLIFANSDIYFNQTLHHLWKISLYESKLFLALLRWEDHPNGEAPTIFGPRADSQDVWIVARDALTFDVTEEDFGFPFGKSGCDNALALVMMRKKFLVVNPAYSIQTIHVHSSNIRTYDPKDVLYRKHYLYVDPTYIQPISVQKNLQSYETKHHSIVSQWSRRVLGKSFTRTILGTSDDAVKTICSMLKQKEENVYFLPNDVNLWTPPPTHLPLYNVPNCFVSGDGLLSTHKEIFIGNHVGWTRKWETAQQSSIMASIHVPNLVALSCDEKQMKSLSHWVLYYLPTAFSIRKIIIQAGLPTPDILVPQAQDVGSFLADSVWGETGNITVTPMTDTMNYYTNSAWIVPPSEHKPCVSKEDIDLLRSLLPEYTPDTTTPTAVFCVDDDELGVLTRDWAENVAERVLPKGWNVHYISITDSPKTRRLAFMQASWIFGKGSALDWIWYATPGKTVMEFMLASEPDSEHIHVAGASGLRYIVSVIKNEPLVQQRQNALMDISRALQKYGFHETLQSIRKNPMVGIPKIILPTGKGLSGIWNHSGDSFREMAEIWAKRGYVTLERSEGTSFCWWGNIGEVLLYDRPTPRWWSDIPPYQMALFGNCAPPGPEKHTLRQSIWGFWPRSPIEVEDMHDSKRNMLSYKNREISSLFLGKVENGVQHAKRFKQDWSSCVELFSMPVDSTGSPYPYTQSEYLQKLCHAKFGLCLPGFGPKCNREIEYFACGCVPIVTDGVDMKNYLVPPVEGVHYFKANSPEEVVKIVKETKPEKWLEMSLAGRDWWTMISSAQGLFRLTWARIEQCRPYLHVGIPQSFSL